MYLGLVRGWWLRTDVNARRQRRFRQWNYDFYVDFAWPAQRFVGVGSGWGGLGWGGVMLTFMSSCDTRGCYVTSWVGWGWEELTFMSTCDRRGCYVTSWVGWGGGVMLTVMSTCDTRGCYVTSCVGWGGGG